MGTKTNGCLIALAVVGGLAIVTVMFVGAGGYFIYSLYKTHEAVEKASASSEAKSEAASISDKAAAPRRATLPPEVLVMSADRAILRDEALNLSGQFEPVETVNTGKFTLAAVNFGGNSAFGDFEHDLTDTSADAPITLDFTDAGPTPASKDREAPPALSVAIKRYSLTRDKVTFSGNDPKLGEISFTGKIDPAFLIRLDDTNHRPGFEDAAVMSGVLTIGGKVFSPVTFNYVIND